MTKLVITTSIPLTDEQRKKIDERLKEKYGEYVAEYKVETALIGGISIFDGNKLYDGSIKNHLKYIRDKICVTKG